MDRGKLEGIAKATFFPILEIGNSMQSHGFTRKRNLFVKKLVVLMLLFLENVLGAKSCHPANKEKIPLHSYVW